MKKSAGSNSKKPKKKRSFFVLTMRLSTLKLCGITAVCLGILFVLIAFIPAYVPDVTNSLYTGTANVKFNKIKTNEDRVDFLEQFGWQVFETPVEEKKVTVPTEFDKVLLSYNEFQKAQGLDLNKYKGKELMRYTYVVTNYPDYEGKVFANILIYKNRVVAGDICSEASDGFLQGLVMKDNNQK